MPNADEQIQPGVFFQVGNSRAPRPTLQRSEGAYRGGILFPKISPTEVQFQELYQRLLASPKA